MPTQPIRYRENRLRLFTGKSPETRTTAACPPDSGGDRKADDHRMEDLLLSIIGNTRMIMLEGAGESEPVSRRVEAIADTARRILVLLHRQQRAGETAFSPGSPDYSFVDEILRTGGGERP